MQAFKTLAALLLAAATLPALAQTEYFTSYTVTTAPQSPAITDIVMLEAEELNLEDSSLSLTRPFNVSGFGFTTVLNNPFPSNVPMQQSLLLGIMTGLPGDAPGQEHLVLMMDPTAASNAANIAWGTLFTSTLEEDLIDAVHVVGQNLPFEDPVLQAALTTLFDFGRYGAAAGNLGPNGLPASAWFSTGGSFTVMAWSDAQQVGSGFSDVLAVAVPEPQSLALLCAGLGVLAWLVRRREISVA